jgi:chromodomain-helicase-DNA-binding protein 1
MSTSPEASPVNGHDHESMSEHMDVDDEFAGNQSDESDLSDVHVADADADAPTSDSVTVAVAAPGKHVVAGEDHSEASDNDASEDADFDDLPDSPPSPGSEDEQFRDLSLESRPPPKRKSNQTVEEDFMRENPELYGLRRSVRCPLFRNVT